MTFLMKLLADLTKELGSKVVCNNCKAESLTNKPGDTCYFCKKGVMK